LSELKRLKQQIREILKRGNTSLRNIPINELRERLMSYVKATCEIDLLVRDD
jgi:hypothetical protein